MAERNIPKIVILADELIGQTDAAEAVLSAAAVKREEIVDAVSIMATDFEPSPVTACKNVDAGFFTADLSEGDVKKLQARKDVLEVIDDEVTYAYNLGPTAGGTLLEEHEEVSAEDFDEAMIEHDDAEMRALADELNPDLAMPLEEPSQEEIDLVSRFEPGLTDEDIKIEHALLDLFEEASGELPLPPGLRPVDFVPAVRGVYKSLIEQKRAIEDVSDEELETMLRTREALEVGVAARDIILPNIRQIFANYAWRYSQGANVRLAIVDTGISPHPDLRIYGGVSFVPGVTSWRDDHGHGTHVSGSAAAVLNGRGIAGVAPRAKLYAVKVLDRNGRGRMSSIVNGLVWCYRRHMHVINLSLGSPFNSHDPRRYNTLYERVGRLLRSRGILAVAAAGNDRRHPVGNPARCPSFMAVSAIDNRRRFASFSNIGPQVEICAPGVQVLSTTPGGYRRMSGTSMASPHVAGAAALAKSRHPTWHGDVIRRRLMATALDLGRPGRDWFFGHGQVNAYRMAR